tara:strand:- start:261 stop:677 length:417 start_codon:yes stop_codon:yes gene_type:complete
MKKFKIIILAIFTCVGCGNEYNFPNTNVNIAIPITMPEYTNVYNNIWGYEYLNGGFGGIIITKDMNDNFIAYDRACTYDIDSQCSVSGQSINDPVLICEQCCDSQFIIVDGSVTNGPANQALKRYSTYFDGNILYITN